MSRRKNRERIIIEWERRPNNIGVVTPYPFSILEEYVVDEDLDVIIHKFWDEKIQKVSLLDECALMRYWWKDARITAARTAWFKHPVHHSSEYIFDREDERMMIRIRQPDIDGEHWIAPHIHLLRGKINPAAPYLLWNPSFNEHVELIRPEIAGKYVCVIK
jgi:hypothetical protein